MMFSSLIGLFVIAAVAGGSLPSATTLFGAQCDSTSIGLGIVRTTDTYGGAFFGRAAAEVFEARNTHIRSLTVWRQPDPAENQVPMHLFIGEMNSSDPQRPDPLSILLDGPTIRLQGTSLVPRPVKFTFD